MKSYIYFIAIAVLFLTCKKEKTEIIEKGIKGNYSGQVFSKTGDNSDFRVEITDEKDFQQTTYTDSLGKFNFSNLSFGEYNVIYSKTGFGTRKKFGVYISGLYNYDDAVTLYPIIKSKIISFDSISVPTEYIYYAQVYLDISIDSSGYSSLLYVFNNNKDCDIENFKYYLLSSYRLDRSTEKYSSSFSFDNLVKLGAKKGDLLYVKIYPIYNGDEPYFDYLLDRYVFPTANLSGGSEVKSFTIPNYSDLF